MTTKIYAWAIGMIMLGIFSVDVDVQTRLGLGAIVGISSVAVNILFRWKSLEDRVVARMTAQVQEQIFKDPEISQLLGNRWKKRFEGAHDAQ
jgi:hypothetical protein